MSKHKCQVLKGLPGQELISLIVYYNIFNKKCTETFLKDV